MAERHDPQIHAMLIGYLALVEVLERSEMIRSEELINEIKRYRNAEKPEVEANLRGLIEGLELRMFGPRQLGVINGGKRD